MVTEVSFPPRRNYLRSLRDRDTAFGAWTNPRGPYPKVRPICDISVVDGVPRAGSRMSDENAVLAEKSGAGHWGVLDRTISLFLRIYTCFGGISGTMYQPKADLRQAGHSPILNDGASDSPGRQDACRVHRSDRAWPCFNGKNQIKYQASELHCFPRPFTCRFYSLVQIALRSVR